MLPITAVEIINIANWFKLGLVNIEFNNGIASKKLLNIKFSFSGFCKNLVNGITEIISTMSTRLPARESNRV